VLIEDTIAAPQSAMASQSARIVLVPPFMLLLTATA
jgi:hypothetical protein